MNQKLIIKRPLDIERKSPNLKHRNRIISATVFNQLSNNNTSTTKIYLPQLSNIDPLDSLNFHNKIQKLVADKINILRENHDDAEELQLRIKSLKDVSKSPKKQLSLIEEGYYIPETKSVRLYLSFFE